VRGLGRFLTREAALVAGAVETRSLSSFQAEFRSSNGNGGYTGYGKAWQVPGAWRASTLLGGLIGALPLDGYRCQQGRPPVLIDPRPVLLENPVPGRTNIDVIASWVHDYLFHGNAMGIVAARDPETGWPTALVPVPAQWVSVTSVANLSPFDYDTLGGNVLYRVGADVFGPRDVFHVRGPSEPGALRGVGVLEANVATIDLANEQRRQAAALAAHGVPTGVLAGADPDITPAELAAAKASWIAAQSTRTIAALPPGVTFSPIAWNPEELQLVEARRLSTQDMALLFGLPGSLLNVESGSWNYSNVGQDGLNLLKFTVNQILIRFEQEWTRHLPRGTKARHDRDAILETDTKERFETYAVGVTSGVLLADEARDREGLPPLPTVPTRSSEVEQALNLAAAAPSLIQNPGLPALVDQLRALSGKPPLNAPAPSVAEPGFEEETA
jgi:HK97 family phage portal protein